MICGVSQSEDTEQGQIRIVRMGEDVLKRSGATLLTVERRSWAPDSTQVSPSAFSVIFTVYILTEVIIRHVLTSSVDWLVLTRMNTHSDM